MKEHSADYLYIFKNTKLKNYVRLGWSKFLSWRVWFSRSQQEQAQNTKIMARHLFYANWDVVVSIERTWEKFFLKQ